MRYFKLLLNIFIPLFHNLLFLLNQIGGFEGTHCSCSSVLFVAHDMASGALAPRKPKYGDPDYYTYNEGESL